LPEPDGVAFNIVPQDGSSSQTKSKVEMVEIKKTNGHFNHLPKPNPGLHMSFFHGQGLVIGGGIHHAAGCACSRLEIVRGPTSQTPAMNIAVVHPSVARAGFSLHASIMMMIHPIPSGKLT
jgi:hypothetical protein